jgi:hypothetical protein
MRMISITSGGYKAEQSREAAAFLETFLPKVRNLDFMRVVKKYQEPGNQEKPE